MPTHDTQGNPWAKLSELKPNDSIRVDSGFTCMCANSLRTVHENAHGLYVRCNEGEHYLIGQTDQDENTLIGIYHVK